MVMVRSPMPKAGMEAVFLQDTATGINLHIHAPVPDFAACISEF
jgi:hypothetical protein